MYTYTKGASKRVKERKRGKGKLKTRDEEAIREGENDRENGTKK